MMKIPSKVHFIGICGIGMSGIAQMLRWMGCDVTGSDRAVDSEENAVFTVPFRKLGIRLYPQDGSFVSKESPPDYLVYSTAIEKDNPDFSAAGGIERVHRAEALASAVGHLRDRVSIAVTGSAGKTSVTGWISEVLAALGEDPVSVTGGIVTGFRTAEFAGNFRPGKGRFLVFEADESDKSLLSYSPDYSVILNVGTDHYSTAELLEVFGKFLSRTSRGAAVERATLDRLGKDIAAGRSLSVFGPAGDLRGSYVGDGCFVRQYGFSGSIPRALLEHMPAGTTSDIALPVPGYHSALNAASVVSLCGMLGIPPERAAECLSSFRGVWRRFELAGENSRGAKVYDDYAHNVEKIVSCIATAAELSRGKVIAVFQPHGFAPLGFMRESLLESLERNMRTTDIFAFLPVYYAGGTSSFTPTSEETAGLFRGRGTRKYLSFKSREEAESALKELSADGDVILVMGARDNSLSSWAKKIAS